MRLGKYIRPIARLTAFVLVCAALLGYLDYRVARAAVFDRLLTLGQRMAPYLDDGRNSEKPRRLHLNGVHLWLSVGHTSHRMAEVRDFYLERYAERGELKKVSEDLRRRQLWPKQAPALNQFSFGDDDRGGVAALDYGEPLSLQGLKARVERFAKSGDLSDIGQLRYAYFEKSDEGTRIVTLWTDDHFRLSDLLPTGHRDAPGTDLEKVPRLQGSVRTLSASEEGFAERAVVYETNSSPAAAIAFYRSTMPTLGWREDEDFKQQDAVHYFGEAGRELVISFSSDRPSATTVAVVQLH